MASSWLKSLPEDLSTNWSVMACPVGQRCLVMAIDGETKWFNKTFHKLPGYFLSVLPGGNGSEYGFGPSVVTLLDCIFEEESERYFVLDCIKWGDVDVKQMTFTERMFFLKQEVMRRPDIKYITDINMYPIIPLYVYGTSAPELDELIRKSSFEIDGLLFFKNDSQYVSGKTADALWTKPYMLPDLIDNISIPKTYMEQKPSQYKDFETFVEDLNNAKWTEKKRKKKGGNPFTPKVELNLPPQQEEPQKGRGKKKKNKKYAQYCYYGPEEGFRGRGLGRGRGRGRGEGRGRGPGRGGNRGQHSEGSYSAGYRGAGNNYRGARQDEMGANDMYRGQYSNSGGDNYDSYYGQRRGARGVYGQGVMTGYQYYGDDRDMYYPPSAGYPQSTGGRKLKGKPHQDPFGMGELNAALSYYGYDNGRNRQYQQGKKPYKLF